MRAVFYYKSRLRRKGRVSASLGVMRLAGSRALRGPNTCPTNRQTTSEACSLNVPLQFKAYTLW